MLQQRMKWKLSPIIEKWVAVWSEGGVDETRGSIRQCGEKDGTAFTSWKPGVYFLPRKNC